MLGRRDSGNNRSGRQSPICLGSDLLLGLPRVWERRAKSSTKRQHRNFCRVDEDSVRNVVDIGIAPGLLFSAAGLSI